MQRFPANNLWYQWLPSELGVAIGQGNQQRISVVASSGLTGRKRYIVKLLPLVLSGFLVLPLVVNAQIEMLHRMNKIPPAFTTYSLFLVCNTKWLAPERNKDLYALYQQFQSFGRVVGPKNAALWFWVHDAKVDSDLAQNIDVERSVRFCQAWQLTPSAGPFLVVTCTYPDESHLTAGLPKDTGVYELGNMTSRDITDLIAGLTDKLTSAHSNSYDPSIPGTFWGNFVWSTQQILNRFGCAWTLKLDAGGLVGTLHACTGG